MLQGDIVKLTQLLENNTPPNLDGDPLRGGVHAHYPRLPPARNFTEDTGGAGGVEAGLPRVPGPGIVSFIRRDGRGHARPARVGELPE